MEKYIGIVHGQIEYELPIAEIAGVLHRLTKELYPDATDADILARIIHQFADPANIVEFMRTIKWEIWAPVARIVKWTDTPPDPPAMTVTAPYNEARKVEIPSDSTGAAPVGLFASLMWQEGMPLFAAIIGDGQTVKEAMIFVRGTPDQVDAHLKVAAQLSAQMHEQPDGAPAPAPRKKFNH